jgi:hypothetical protein
MNEARLFDMIFDPDTKRLANLGGNPDGSVGLPDAKHGGDFAVDLDVAPLNPQHRRRGVARLCVQPRCRPYLKSPREKTAARQHVNLRCGFIADFRD